MTEDLYKPPRKGKLIVLEGIDSSGKSVQAQKLHEKLLSKGAVLFEFPNYLNRTGKLIREILDTEGETISPHSHTWATLLAANRYEDRLKLINSLKFSNVVTNRYWPSNLVYSTASGLNTEWLAGLDSQMPAPDMVIILDIPAAVSFERKQVRDSLERDLMYLERVRKTYWAIGPERGWHIVDATGPIDMVHESIMGLVRELLAR